METIKVLEKGKEFSFSFEDMLNYHGVGYPRGACLSGNEKSFSAFG